jgi:hypothetical protein
VNGDPRIKPIVDFEFSADNEEPVVLTKRESNEQEEFQLEAMAEIDIEDI